MLDCVFVGDWYPSESSSLRENSKKVDGLAKRFPASRDVGAPQCVREVCGRAPYDWLLRRDRVVVGVRAWQVDVAGGLRGMEKGQEGDELVSECWVQGE